MNTPSPNLSPNQYFEQNLNQAKDFAVHVSQSLDYKRPALTKKDSEGVLFPTCRHIKPNGVRCGSPALRGKPLCYYHIRPPKKPKRQAIPVPDPTDIPAVLTFTMHGLMKGTLEPAAAGKIIYLVRNFLMKGAA
jgi:hypothetical protein